MNAPGRAKLGQRPAWAAISLTVWMVLMPTLPQVAVAAERTLSAPATLPSGGAEVDAGMVLSVQAQQLVDWVVLTSDHAGTPFVIVDKKRARIFVFDARAHLRAHSAVLLGLALGDESVSDIGTRPMTQILPAERTTPAGRFVAERGRNTQGEDIVWVDYDAAVSMHRVRTGNALEQRTKRLATPTIKDNRISYGCINVPVAFYENFIQPIFAASKAVVYVLPDIKPVNEVFGIPQTASTGFVAHSAVPAPVLGVTNLVGVRSALRRR